MNWVLLGVTILAVIGCVMLLRRGDKAREHYLQMEIDLIGRREKALTRIFSEYMDKIAARTDTGELVEKIGAAIRDVVNPQIDVPNTPTSPETVGLGADFRPTEESPQQTFFPEWEGDEWAGGNGKEAAWAGAGPDDQGPELRWPTN